MLEISIPIEIQLALVAVLVVLAIVAYVLSQREVRGYEYRAKQYLMTESERHYFHVLEEAVGGEFYIFPQLHLSSIFDHKVLGQKWVAAFAHINQKSVDYVLCSKTDLNIKLAIELDDPSHGRDSRRERDHEVERIFQDSDLPLYRQKVAREYDVTAIRAEIRKHLNSKLQ